MKKNRLLRARITHMETVLEIIMTTISGAVILLVSPQALQRIPVARCVFLARTLCPTAAALMARISRKRSC